MRKYCFIFLFIVFSILFLNTNTFADVSCKAKFGCKHNCSGTAVCPNGEKLISVTKVTHHRACYKGHRVQTSVSQSYRVSDSSWYASGYGNSDNRHDIVIEFVCSGNSCNSGSDYFYGNQNVCGEQNAGSAGPVSPSSPAWVPEIREIREFSNDQCVRGKYISGYKEVWSNCTFVSASGNTLKCDQTSSYTDEILSDWYGTIEYTYQTIDGVKQETPISQECVGGTKPSDAIKQSPKTETKILNLVPSTQTSTQPYANNLDALGIEVKLQGTTNDGESITGIPTTLTNFSSNIKSNIIDGTGGYALRLESNTSVNSSVSPNGVLTTLKITSTTPLKTDKGQLSFKIGGNDVKLNNVTLNYLKPFIGQLEANNPTTGNRDGIVTVGTLNKYRLKINQKINFTSPPTTKIKILNGEEQEFKDTLKGYGNESSKITLSEKKVINTGSLAYNIAGEHNIEFETRLNTTSGATTMPRNPGIQLEKPIISYTLDNKEVKYYLGTTNLGDTINQESIVTEINPIALVGGEFIGVRVIGGIQGGGNSEFTGQKQNISSISSLESRTQIRKNAYTYTNSMTDGQIVNQVKYVEGEDIRISGNQENYGTLVVKNGNVIIDGDLNTNNKVLGIIVLRDGFNVLQDYKTTGNVYVLPNVQKINAIIYADGGLISIKGLDADNKAILYNADSTERTQNLNKQLYMNGSLFTRNTIGGAVLTSQTNGEYTLPGGGKTQDFSLALQYDLNYTRRGNLNCNNAGGVKVGVTPQECTYDEPFIIKYDSRIQTSPPRLFRNY